MDSSVTEGLNFIIKISKIENDLKLYGIKSNNDVTENVLYEISKKVKENTGTFNVFSSMELLNHVLNKLRTSYNKIYNTNLSIPTQKRSIKEL